MTSLRRAMRFLILVLFVGVFGFEDEHVLRVQFEKPMRKIQSAGSHTVLLLDSSGSIGADVWKKRVLPVAGKIVQASVGGRLASRFVSIVTYSSACKIVQTPTDNVDEAQSRSASLLYDGGGTATDEGFACAKTVLPKTDEKGPRFVVYITDGQPDNFQDAREAALDLIVDGVKVFGIGVGSGLALSKLQEMSTSGMAVQVKDYDQLLRLVTGDFQTDTTDDTAYDVDVQVGLAAGTPALELGDFLPLSIRIYNNRDNEDKVIPRGTKVSIRDVGDVPHFMPSSTRLDLDVVGGGVASLSVKLRPRGSTKTVAAVPAKLQLSLTLPTGQSAISAESFAVDVPFHAYSKAFAGTPMNILAIGFPGVGKTTFVKSVATALSREVVEVQNIGGGDGHVTKKITRYGMPDLVYDNAVRVTFWDTWGITRDSFSLQFLDLLAHGVVPSDYSLQEFTRSTSYRVAANQSMVPMDAVLFFIRAVQSKDDELLQRMKGFIVHLTDLGYGSVVVVSWTEEVAPEDLPNIMRTIATELQIPASRVMEFYGYVNDTEKNPILDKNALMITEFAVRHGLANQKMRAIQARSQGTRPGEDQPKPLTTTGIFNSSAWIMPVVITLVCMALGIVFLCGSRRRSKASVPAAMPLTPFDSQCTTWTAPGEVAPLDLRLGASAGLSAAPSEMMSASHEAHEVASSEASMDTAEYERGKEAARNSASWS